MAKYLLHGSYTLEGLKGLIKEGGTGRRKATENWAKSLGGKLEAYYFAFGGNDFYAIADLPDNVSTCAGVIAGNASGAANITTVVLLTPDEVDQAVKKTVDYRPPGH
jgi:uncharacterized protein with GYD domain